MLKCFRWLGLGLAAVVMVETSTSKANMIAAYQPSDDVVCQYVAQFKILNREESITLDHVEFIGSLPDFGVEIKASIVNYLETNGSIKTVTELEGIHNIGPQRIYLLRLFFKLGNPCSVSFLA